MTKEKEKKTGSSNEAIYLVAMISILLILVGAAMTFVPDMKGEFFAYAAGAVFLIAGLFSIIKYLVKEEYRIASNYDFSLGVLLAILGIAAIVRADEMAAAIPVYAGLLVLVNAVIFLQYTVQLKIVKAEGWWFVTLIVTILLTLVSLESLLEVIKLFKKNPGAFYIVLMVVGAIGLLWILIVSLRTKKFLKNEFEMSQRNLEEDMTTGMQQKREAVDPDDPDFIDRI